MQTFSELVNEKWNYAYLCSVGGEYFVARFSKTYMIEPVT